MRSAADVTKNRIAAQRIRNILNVLKDFLKLMMGAICIILIPISVFFFLAVTAFFLISGFPQSDIVTHTPVAQLVSPDGGWLANIEDVQVDTDWFDMMSLTTQLLLRRAGTESTAVLIVGAATNSDPELRPQARWIAPDRLCVVTPRIDSMAVRSGIVEGARIDLHILPWNQKWPPPTIDLDAQCR